jgi:hypothetical protein
MLTLYAIYLNMGVNWYLIATSHNSKEFNLIVIPLFDLPILIGVMQDYHGCIKLSLGLGYYMDQKTIKVYVIP